MKMAKAKTPRKRPRSRWHALPYGKSPFDLMPPAEVRHFAKVAYAALGGARSTLAQHALAGGIYWTLGSGADSLAEVEFARRLVDPTGDDSEVIWRMYYRPAGPMLFAGCKLNNGMPTRAPWMACDKCNQFFSTLPELPPPTHCSLCPDRPGLRPLTLEEVENYSDPGAVDAVSPLPCPFCGHGIPEEDRFDLINEGPTPRYAVHCGTCGASGPWGGGRRRGDHEGAKRHAVEAWNDAASRPPAVSAEGGN